MPKEGSHKHSKLLIEEDVSWALAWFPLPCSVHLFLFSFDDLNSVLSKVDGVLHYRWNLNKLLLEVI